MNAGLSFSSFFSLFVFRIKGTRLDFILVAIIYLFRGTIRLPIEARVGVHYVPIIQMILWDFCLLLFIAGIASYFN